MPYKIEDVNKFSIPFKCEKRGEGYLGMLFGSDHAMIGEIWRRPGGGWAYFMGDRHKKLFRIKLDRAEGLFTPC